jgi:hypothetical protein
MQPYNDGPRAAFTAAQVSYLIEQSSSPQIDKGLELLTGFDLNVDSDISDRLISGSVSRSNYADIHGSATFALDQPLDWGNSLVRPYYLMTGPTSATARTLTTMKFYLGAFFTDSPDEDASSYPPTWDVTGYDILSILDDPIGDDYAVDLGEDPLAHVESILLGRGITQYKIDQDATGKLLGSPLVYAMTDNTTWLTVVNDLLAYVGYQSIWTDWNGVFRAQTYTTPALRGSEWFLGIDVADTLMTQRRKIARDFYDAPNRWVFYRSNNTDAVGPSDGAGRFEYINNSQGETSIEARGGRTITKVVSLDIADQVSLESAAQATIDADMAIPTTFSIETAPLPLVWHFDKFTVNDPALGAAQDVLGSTWTLALDGSDMTHEWTAI